MRILLDITLFFSALTAPFPVTLLLMIAGLLYYPRYFEPVVVAALIEFWYRGQGPDAFGAHLSLAAMSLFCFFAAELVRKFIRQRPV